MIMKKLINIFSRQKTEEHEPHKKRILFIVKKRTLPDYDCSGRQASTGLINSAKFVSDFVNTFPCAVSEVVEVIDNNCIDKVVSSFKPDIVVIEALWVVPEKITVLKELHPNVKWIIRLHSDTPFLAHEGVAIDWIKQYIVNGAFIGVNSERIERELNFFLPGRFIHYLPNYYPLPDKDPALWYSQNNVCWDALDIGCFGAIRPMKSQLLQAIVAIKFAKLQNKKLRFHINSNRCEDKGDGVLKNIRALFENDETADLIEHSWMPHEDFLDVIGQMDINMQVSLSETFNIVAADSVYRGIPLVVSKEINWVNPKFQADATDSTSILETLERAFKLGQQGKHSLNFVGLKKYNEKSKDAWLEMITE